MNNEKLLLKYNKIITLQNEYIITLLEITKKDSTDFDVVNYDNNYLKNIQNQINELYDDIKLLENDEK